jgi:phosphoribosyl 1,2-cyclic phosphodiesterase
LSEIETPEFAQAPKIEVRAWGVRGSLPTPSAEVLGFGGNTPCVELKFGSDEGCKQRIILDAGTGIRYLGMHLLKSQCTDTSFHIFLSHFHWDHVQGLPFFPALYRQESKITFYSHRTPAELKEILWGQMATPYFPVRFIDIAATVNFVQVDDESVMLGEVEVRSFPLTHPQGSSGFRVSYRGKTIVYATDHEHGQENADLRLLEAAKSADLLFYDSQYTVEEYPHRMGWGHGTWLQATRVATAAEVKQLVLFHHDPSHDDVRMEEILADARLKFPCTIAAREGETLIVR